MRKTIAEPTKLGLWNGGDIYRVGEETEALERRFGGRIFLYREPAQEREKPEGEDKERTENEKEGNTGSFSGANARNVEEMLKQTERTWSAFADYPRRKCCHRVCLSGLCCTHKRNLPSGSVREHRTM